jgi:hypothetical protein
MSAWESAIRADGTDAQRQVAARVSLNACGSRAEWLAAVQPYIAKTPYDAHEIVIVSMSPSSLLSVLCASSYAPACR